VAATWQVAEVDWHKTVFLNMIIHTSFQLTLSVSRWPICPSTLHHSIHVQWTLSAPCHSADTFYHSMF